MVEILGTTKSSPGEGSVTVYRVEDEIRRKAVYKRYRELASRAWRVLKDAGLTRKRSDGMSSVELSDRSYPHERWRVGIEIEDEHRRIRMVQVLWSPILKEEILGRELVFDWGWQAADRKAEGDISDCGWAVENEATHWRLMSFLGQASILGYSAE